MLLSVYYCILHYRLKSAYNKDCHTTTDVVMIMMILFDMG
jgi:hypothetical protein